MSAFSSLNRSQKEAIGLLQVGTFLEYFDLMLYVHMAVLLNELFFPKTDPHTAALITAFAFCSTYVLRPFGALIFGWIGDHIGRKTTVIITTMMMSISCIIMASLPTYAQIGITATWIITLCRIMQGLSSMGEIIGAEIYVTEIVKPPAQYPAVSFISVASSVGSVAALGISVLVTTHGFNWRIAFWIGAAVAMVGTLARTRLRETPEFIDSKRIRQKEIEESTLSDKQKYYAKFKLRIFSKREQIHKKTLLAYFLVYCGWPLSFYLGFMYFNPVLKSQFNYSPEDIIFHNFFLSILVCGANIVWSVMSYKIYPMKILKARGILFLFLAVFFPFLIISASHYLHIFMLQALILMLTLGGIPADSIFIKHFPVLKRFTATSFLYAATRAVMYVVTSFGLVYLSEYFGHWGLLVITMPVAIGYLWGVDHFSKLDNSTSLVNRAQPLQFYSS